MTASSPVLHLGADLRCMHGGRAGPLAEAARVCVGGRAVLTTAVRVTVTGCPHGPPCLEGRFLAGAARVRVGGVPVAVAGAPALTLPSGGPLVTAAAQARVHAG